MHEADNAKPSNFMLRTSCFVPINGKIHMRCWLFRARGPVESWSVQPLAISAWLETQSPVVLQCSLQASAVTSAPVLLCLISESREQHCARVSSGWGNTGDRHGYTMVRSALRLLIICAGSCCSQLHLSQVQAKQGREEWDHVWHRHGDLYNCQLHSCHGCSSG